MNKMTIQQGIYLLATLSSKESELLSEINGYRVPLAVNGKDVTDKKQAQDMLKAIEELEIIQKDMIKLKVVLTNANSTVITEGKSINELLEEVKRKRRYLSTVSSLNRSGHTTVETGVGVVQYGILNADLIKKEVKTLELEVNKLSQLIDTLNAKNHIEVDLSSEY